MRLPSIPRGSVVVVSQSLLHQGIECDGLFLNYVCIITSDHNSANPHFFDSNLAYHLRIACRILNPHNMLRSPRTPQGFSYHLGFAKFGPGEGVLTSPSPCQDATSYLSEISYARNSGTNRGLLRRGKIVRQWLCDLPRSRPFRSPLVRHDEGHAL